MKFSLLEYAATVMVLTAATVNCQLYTDECATSDSRSEMCKTCALAFDYGTDSYMYKGCCHDGWNSDFKFCSQCAADPLFCYATSAFPSDDVDITTQKNIKTEKRYGSLGIGSSWRYRRPTGQNTRLPKDDVELFQQNKRYGSMGIGQSSWRYRQPNRQKARSHNGPRRNPAGTRVNLYDDNVLQRANLQELLLEYDIDDGLQ